MTYLNRLSELKTAFSRLEEAMPKVQDQLDKDGAIQRFEFVFELLWKTLKDYVQDKGRFDANSPKDAFRVAADLGLIDDPQIWFEFLKNRNTAAHIYDEDSANKIYSSIPIFVSSVKSLIITIENEYQKRN